MNNALTDALSKEVILNTGDLVQRASDALDLMDMFARHSVSSTEIKATAQEVAAFYRTGSKTLTGLDSLSDSAIIMVREVEHLNMAAGNGSRLLTSINQELDRRLEQREGEVSTSLEIWERRDENARKMGRSGHVFNPVDRLEIQ